MESNPSGKENEEIERSFEKGGCKEVIKLMRRKLDDWKKYDINVAVIGNSGTGKSSFINAIRGLKANDVGAAAVGATETTNTVTSYPHPDNSKLLIHDLPGLGTPNFPRENYLEQVKFDSFDFYIMVSCTRFTENDEWLAHEIKEQKKGFIFLRTKIDVDVSNFDRDHPHAEFNEKVFLETLRQDCKPDADSQVFLIANHEPQKYEFAAAVDKIVEDAPSAQKETLILSLNIRAKSLLEQKKSILTRRIYLVALASALCGAVPIPGLSVVLNTSIILSEVNFYRTEFGLDDISFEKLKKEYGDRCKTIQVILYSCMAIAHRINLLLTYHQAPKVMTQSALSAIPVLGSFVGGGISYCTASNVLKDQLEKLYSLAISVMELACEKERKKSL